MNRKINVTEFNRLMEKVIINDLEIVINNAVYEEGGEYIPLLPDEHLERGDKFLLERNGLTIYGEVIHPHECRGCPYSYEQCVCNCTRIG